VSFVQPQDLRDALFDRFHYVRRRSQAIEGFGAFFNSDIELVVLACGQHAAMGNGALNSL